MFFYFLIHNLIKQSYQIFGYHFPTEFPEALIRPSINFTIHYEALLVLMTKKRLLTFHAPIFLFLFQTHSPSVIPPFWASFKKFVTVYFYLAGGLAHHKTLNLKGQDFWSDFTPLYDLLSPQLPECHLPLVWFWSVLLPGGLQPSSRVPPTLSW